MKFLDAEVLLIRAVICIVSTLGCIWHLSDVSRIYFTYETDVNVDFERDSMVDIPAITVCINSSLATREDYLRARFPELDELLTSHNESRQYFLGKYLRNLTLYEQLNEATLNAKEIFNSCLVMTPVEFESDNNKDYVDCELLSPIREYITYSKKCFLIGSQFYDEHPSRFTVDHDITLRDNGFPLFQIRLNNRFLNRPMVFVQPRRVPFLGFMGGQTNGVHLNSTKYASYTFSFVKNSLRLLPAPYQTNCRDYREIGYKSLSHCIVACKAISFVQRFSGWHPDIPAGEEYFPNLAVPFADLKLKENKTLDKIIADECLQVCSKQEDCHSEFYNLIQIGHFERTHVHSGDLHSIYLYLPTGINTRYFHSPRLHLTEFICYFASVFSFWFGFSIVTTSKAAIKLYQLYKRKSLTADTPPGIGGVKVRVVEQYFDS